VTIGVRIRYTNSLRSIPIKGGVSTKKAPKQPVKAHLRTFLCVLNYLRVIPLGLEQSFEAFLIQYFTNSSNSRRPNRRPCIMAWFGLFWSFKLLPKDSK
jgi:hypothetical protein